MNAKHLKQLGIPSAAVKTGLKAVGQARRTGDSPDEIRRTIKSLVASPDAYLDTPVWGDLAAQVARILSAQAAYRQRDEPVPYRQWGRDHESGALQQMSNAVKLPVAMAGALMPDAHQGYGLPIGGVLGTHNSVIPYAVGVDIACRMKLTVLDMPVSDIDEREDALRNAISRETRFGIGSSFKQRRDHAVMDEDWSVTGTTSKSRDKAWSQLGSSGSGNHFVEFGELELGEPDLGLESGVYMALLSHSGSRGTGAAVAGHYSKLAMSLHPELPRELAHLSWLELDSEEGIEYWSAMQLMGKYAAANHELIHRSIARNLGVEVLADLENHHNFAWKETHGGEEMVGHRKGATPAGEGVLGIIPGSMGTPGYVVRGKGKPESLNSCSHGAGRRMSRTQAKKTFNWEDTHSFLEAQGVKLISAGLDEVPGAYKDIEAVMTAQRDLVHRVAQFRPRLVKMAPPGERPED